MTHMIASQFWWVRNLAQPSWVLQSGMFTAGNQGVSGAAVISRFQAHVVVGRIQLPMDYWTEGLSVSMAVDRKLPSVLCHMGHPNMAVCFIKAHRPREGNGELASKKWVTILCNLTTEVTAYHLFHILLVRIKSLTQPHSKGRDSTRRV